MIVPTRFPIACEAPSLCTESRRRPCTPNNDRRGLPTLAPQMAKQELHEEIPRVAFQMSESCPAHSRRLEIPDRPC